MCILEHRIEELLVQRHAFEAATWGLAISLNLKKQKNSHIILFVLSVEDVP